MTPDADPTRETLVARIGALRALVERQRLYIGSMRASRFWQVRDRVFALFGKRDPLPVPTADERAITEAALGNAYQLYRIRTRRSAADAAWLRGLTDLLAVRETIELVLDVRGADENAAAATLASIVAQIYPHWRVRAWLDDGGVAAQRDWLTRAARSDPRVSAEPWDGATLGSGVAFGAVVAGDLLEPEALLLVAIELHHGADVVYTDEDRLRDDGVCDEPRFKPDWSPETELSYDYVGDACVVRSTLLAAAGGIDAAAASACWFDLRLRATERTTRIAHSARVMVHARPRAMTAADRAAAIERALRRRGEEATVRALADGADIAFAAPPAERVAVIVPTRDRAALLEACVRSVFERTAHPSFEVIVVDNGSAEPATHELFAHWSAREPERFRVIRDDGPFNYSRLNNVAVRATDAPYVVLLNNDTEVIAPDWMTAMLGQGRRPEIGAVGALLLYGDGTVQHAGVVLGGVLGLAGHAFRAFDPDAPGAPRALRYDTNYLAVTGACLLVARSKFEAAGGLDESLAVAFNDVDLCLKLHAAGYRNVVVPRARLHHFESKSRGLDDTRAKQVRAFAESEALRRRWSTFATADPYYNPNLTLRAEDCSVTL